MAIEKTGSMRGLVCNSCGDVYEEFENSRFLEVTTAAKEEGWKFREIDRTWEHFCPTCPAPTSGGAALAAARKKFGR